MTAKQWTPESVGPFFPPPATTTSGFLNAQGGQGTNQMISVGSGAMAGGGFLSNLGGITPMTFANTTITPTNRNNQMPGNVGGGGPVVDPLILLAGEMK